MYEIAVCDDSEMDRKRLTGRIGIDNTQYELRIHEFESGLELLEAMVNIQFAAVFLDIQMADLSGDLVAKKIRELDANLVLVFYTGFAEPSPQSFEVQPYRYIMKNMSDQQIEEYVKAALDKVVKNGSMPQLVANINKRRVLINPQHVVYIEKYKKSTKVHLAAYAYRIYNVERKADNQYPDIRLSEPLEETYEILRRYGFGCPHSSYIINFSYLRSCTSKTLELADISGDFQITRSKAKTFREEKGYFLRAKYAGGSDSV